MFYLFTCRFERHSVYRTLFPYMEALHRDGYRMILMQIGGVTHDTRLELFESHHIFDTPSDLDKATQIAHHIKQMDPSPTIIWYPAIGMDWPTVYLSNRRLVPIQIASVGHSVSTFGSQVDYWITGEDAEDWSEDKKKKRYSYRSDRFAGTTTNQNKESDSLHQFGDRYVPRAANHYSETLVVIAGNGVVNRRPSPPLPTKSPILASATPNDVIIINCPFSAQKVNYPFLRTLRRAITGVATATNRTILFRFFPYLTPKLQRMLWRRELLRILASDDDAANDTISDYRWGTNETLPYDWEHGRLVYDEPVLSAPIDDQEQDIDGTPLKVGKKAKKTKKHVKFEDEATPIGVSVNGIRNGVQVEVYGEVLYARYMELMSQGHLIIEANHYGMLL
jgi:hypothetical protein